MIRILKNKKAVDSMLATVVSYFGIMVIFIIFIVIFSFLNKTHDFDIKGKSIELDSKIFLNEFLESEIEFEYYKNQPEAFKLKASVAEHIAYSENDYKNMIELKKELEQQLNYIRQQGELDYIYIKINYVQINTHSFDLKLIDRTKIFPAEENKLDDLLNRGINNAQIEIPSVVQGKNIIILCKVVRKDD